MTALITVGCSLCTAMIMLFVNTAINRHREKTIKRSSIENDVLYIKSRIDGIESFSNSISDLKSRMGAREEICMNNHRPWNGVERRQKI